MTKKNGDVIKNKSPQTVHAVVRAFKKITTRKCTKKTHSRIGKFRRNFLPLPEEFYQRELKRYSRNKSQCTGLCPFHDDHIPSFTANLKTGTFICFGCGASGGNVLDFFMKKNEVGFVDACKALGAWHG